MVKPNALSVSATATSAPSSGSANAGSSSFAWTTANPSHFEGNLMRHFDYGYVVTRHSFLVLDTERVLVLSIGA